MWQSLYFWMKYTAAISIASWQCKRGVITLGMLFCCIIATTSCNNTRYLAQNEILLHKATVHIADQKKQEQLPVDLSETLYNLVRPKPNKRFLSVLPFKLRLSIYNQNKKAKKGTRRWLRDKIGEAPVLYDSTATLRSARMMETYLFNQGFFNGKVVPEVKFSKRRASVDYNIHLSQPYTFGDIHYPPPHDDFLATINNLKETSLLRTGNRFDNSVLQAEIDRLLEKLRNIGYYDLNQSYFHYKLDSAKSNHAIETWLTVKPPADTSRHIVYTIRNVYIYPQYYSEKTSDFYTDTLLYQGFNFIYPKDRQIAPKVIAAYLLTKPNSLYSQNNHNFTVNNLLDLGVFKFVNLHYEKVKSPTNSQLDCYIYLTPAKQMSISAEAEVNNGNRYSNAFATQGGVGTALSLGYKNKNVFSNAEIFSFNLHGGFDFVIDTINSSSVELNGELSLTIPRFLLPFNVKRISSYYRPKTRLSLRMGVESLFGGRYRRNTATALYSYEWREDISRKHTYTPILISLVSPSNFTSLFDQQTVAFEAIQYSLSRQLLLSSIYNFSYSNQATKKQGNFMIFKGNLELTGNLAGLVVDLANIKLPANTPGPGGGQGLDLPRYVRLDVDFAHYNRLSREQSFVTRYFAGIGIPYKTPYIIMPNSKQFFVGGPYSIRGFRSRDVGPGSMPLFFDYLASNGDTVHSAYNRVTRVGDIKLEANAEYRFSVYKWIKGALFVDAGNVWAIHKDEDRPNAEFDIRRFWREIAIGTGLGVRFDFSFFIFRIDLGIPIYDPRLSGGKAWLPYPDGIRRSINTNLAIGYPF